MSFLRHSYAIRMSFICQTYVIVCYLYVIQILLECIRISFVCYSYVLVYYLYVLVCHPYVTRMYSWCFISMLLVFTRISSVCHLYVLVCHLYVTRMYLYVICMSLVCHSYVLVCHPYVTRMWFYRDLYYMQMLPVNRHNTVLVQMELPNDF